nr:PREDICTED: uncharacterized protein LOC109034187 [Bemisia tabaci]
MQSKRTWSRLSLALWLSLLSGALGASLKTPLAPSRIPRSSMRRIKGYADVLFPRPANCVLFAHEPGVADHLVAKVAQGLGRPVMAKNALDTLLMQRYCEGLVILAETTSALAVFMQRAVAANWSFRVLALMVADGEPKDTRAFTLLRRNKFLNFNQREMNVSAFSCPLFVVFKRHDDDGQPNSVRDIDGIEYRIFLEFARILNFRWTMTVPRGRDKWGMPRWKDEPPRGMVQMLIERKIELAICSWWLEVAKKKYIDLSTYWHSCCMTFLLPKPEPYSIQWSAFLRPFSIDLWLALILTTCFIAAVYWMNFDFRTRSIQPGPN